MLGAETRLVALLGHPVAHSLSPRMQNAAFAARGLDWAYVACDVAPGGLRSAVVGLGALGFAGANVTAPHKLAATRLDVVDTDAPSVNILRCTPEGIEGWTSDAAIVEDLDPRRPIILGDGGSAAAFAHALRDLEPRRYARRGEWPPDVSGADLVVNATSARDEILAELGPDQTLVDLPYPESATAVAARAAGARVISGLEVLVAQGAASFELWTGIAAPVEVMRRAVGLPA
ncbi:MAG: shikimate dehydrogenase [Gaiellaceae bacterium]